MNRFNEITSEILELVNSWETKLLALNHNDLTNKKDIQNRTVKQSIGHLVDSASNNTHRIIHLQYQNSPCNYPDYANLGNNNKWIEVQNYQDEEWVNLVQLWKFTNFHLVHVIHNIKVEHLQNEWISALNEKITLKAMVTNYPRHLEEHLLEIEELINS